MTLTTLRICGKPFKIVRCTSDAMDRRDPAGVEGFGKLDIDRLEIAILEDMPKPLEKDCILHEAVHAIDEQTDLGLTEHQVEVLGCMLQLLFADNPALLKYLNG